MTYQEALSILKVNDLADLHEVKGAYKRLAKQHHPDAGGQKEAFQRLQEAFDIVANSAPTTSPKTRVELFKQFILFLQMTYQEFTFQDLLAGCSVQTIEQEQDLRYFLDIAADLGYVALYAFSYQAGREMPGDMTLPRMMMAHVCSYYGAYKQDFSLDRTVRYCEDML